MSKDSPPPHGGLTCRFCGDPLSDIVVDLGMSPLCESYVRPEQLNAMEPFYPLRVFVCRACWLVQLDEYVSGEHIFTEYAYFSSFSESWLQHARDYTQKMIDRFGLGPKSQVVEVASNDGYLLRWFVEAGVPSLGIEPAANVAAAAEAIGVETIARFFGVELANELVAAGRRADLVVGNNVLAQVPDLNDFVAGMAILLAPDGVVTMEFPHVLRLIEDHQFDTIYHEHFSYFTLHTTRAILNRHGLTLFDVEELPTHGGSLRVFARHDSDISKPTRPAVDELLKREELFGLTGLERYSRFSDEVEETKRGLLDLLIRLKREGKRIAGYGAPGKGNTLLNYCGVRSDFLDFTVDRNTYKQGLFLPGTHIPILAPEEIYERRPDFLLILPWNIKDEIIEQMAGIRDWGGQFIVPIPEARIIP
jgi:C-methyltransferase-like protein/putative zinc binding protein/methyltransferase family protein